MYMCIYVYLYMYLCAYIFLIAIIQLLIRLDIFQFKQLHFLFYEWPHHVTCPGFKLVLIFFLFTYGVYVMSFYHMRLQYFVVCLS